MRAIMLPMPAVTLLEALALFPTALVDEGRAAATAVVVVIQSCCVPLGMNMKIFCGMRCRCRCG